MFLPSWNCTTPNPLYIRIELGKNKPGARFTGFAPLRLIVGVGQALVNSKNTIRRKSASLVGVCTPPAGRVFENANSKFLNSPHTTGVLVSLDKSTDSLPIDGDRPENDFAFKLVLIPKLKHLNSKNSETCGHFGCRMLCLMAWKQQDALW